MSKTPLTDEEKAQLEAIAEKQKTQMRKGGQALRAIRESKRLSQEDIAERTRIQLSRLSHIERGLVAKPPSLRDMAELAFQYGLSPRSVFEIYGLPVVRTSVADSGEDPEELIALRAVLQELPDELSRAEVLGMVGWVVDMANAKILAVSREDATEPQQRRVRRARA